MLCSMKSTTIKVQVEFRERVAKIARERGMTQASVLEQALEQLLWKFRMDQVRDAMAQASPEDVASYESEFKSWTGVFDEAFKDG